MLRLLRPLCIGLVFLGAAQTANAAPPYRLEEVAGDFHLPWSIAFLPRGEMLVTELSGQLQHVLPHGRRRAVAGVPEVYFRGQGGLMDVVLHPRFAQNNLIYLTYAEGDRRHNALAVMRARLDLAQMRLTQQRVIFRAAPKKNTPVHYGARMVFLADESFLLTVGDGFDYREEAQNLTNHFGTVVRLDDKGAPKSDNPFAGRVNARQEIWSYGHRNAQAIVRDAAGRIFIHEHGPRGGDELNRILPGKNYGWPLATHGLDYSGARVSPYEEYPGTEQPLVHWVPSVAPSGMTSYNGTKFPAWRGDLFLTTLVDKNVVRLDMVGGAVKAQETLFEELDARLRDIRTSPDGALYILTESAPGGSSSDKTGRVVRVVPK